jgi:hypothetical protein
MLVQMIISISSYAAKVFVYILFALFAASVRSDRELKLSASKWIQGSLILFFLHQ